MLGYENNNNLLKKEIDGFFEAFPKDDAIAHIETLELEMGATDGIYDEWGHEFADTSRLLFYRLKRLIRALEAKRGMIEFPAMNQN